MTYKTQYKFDSQGNLWVMIPKADLEKEAPIDADYAKIMEGICSRKIKGKLRATDIARAIGYLNPNRSVLIKIANHLRDCGYDTKRDGLGRYFVI